MGSGEADVRHISVSSNNTWTAPTFDNTWTTSTYWYPSTIYLYQIRCPVRSCKKMNWLQLDMITPCNTCGAKLKAVLEQADFEVPVTK